MAILKCKMCGGDIILSEDKTFGTCDSCGSTMTFPKVSDEHKLNLYNRANHFRRQNEFDKAIAAYDKILDQDDTDAEAHWGAVLSRYGIEYVEDPSTHERIPTCHRVQAVSILSDPDYLSALEYAPDTASRDIYEQEARRIAEIQKGILAISSQEKPYDVFICYKETDEAGRRTKDSTLAQDIYYQLTTESYKVFFSRITLEDKLGQQYEPYIFAALNSAKVMLVVGTKPEYFNAVWVKNEWSRYLALMKNDRTRLLIPCYRDMDPYDLPEELSALQSQDMSKIGFIQDITRGIKKVLSKPEPKPQPVMQQAPAATANIENLMKRARLFMEDGDFTSANEYLDKVLDENAEYAPAYVGKVCTALGFRKEAELAEATFLYAENLDWEKALRFANPQQKAVYEGYYEQVKARVVQQIRDYAFDCAMEMAVKPQADRKKLDEELEEYTIICAIYGRDRADGKRRPGSQKNEQAFQHAVAQNEPGDVTEDGLKTAAAMLETIGDDEAKACAKQCVVLAEQARQKAIYLKASGIQKLNRTVPTGLDKAAQLFKSIPEYKDAEEQAQRCLDKAETIRADLYNRAVEAMNNAGSDSWKWKTTLEKLDNVFLNDYRDVGELRDKAAKRYDECIAVEKEARQATVAKKKRNTILGILAAVVVVAAVLIVTLVIIPGNNYRNAVALQQAGKYKEAITAFEALNGYGDSAAQIEACRNSIRERDYQAAVALQRAGRYDEAIVAFTALDSYSDSKAQISETKYLQAKALTAKGDFAGAVAIFTGIKGYKDVDSLLVNDQNLSAAVAAAAAARDVKYSVGNYVTFGHYPQTSGGNDNTEIEWLVLARDGNKALLISRYGLDAKPYNEMDVDIKWEECTLRTWLNWTFLNKAFTAQEQKGILTTTVDNMNQGYSKWYTYGGNNTQDKVFLLSYAEANKYLGLTNDDRKNTKSRVAPTAYAIKQGGGTSDRDKTADGMAAGFWWLRSPGSDWDAAAIVENDGSLGLCNVYMDFLSVRPALWINLESDIF